MYPDKFVNVTNGVTQRRWLLHCNPLLAQFLFERIGREWITDLKQIHKIAESAADPKSQEAFLAIKKENKKALIAYLKENNPLRDEKGKVIDHSSVLGEEALFDVQIKRIHEYKRQLMNILHTLIVYNELKANLQARKIKRMVIFAGKAAPGYEMAKNIITLIYAVARKVNGDPAVNGMLKIAFLEDYNISRAELIIPAADLSQQISTSGLEASGTGNMKLAMNGALTICTEDGSNMRCAKRSGIRTSRLSLGKPRSKMIRCAKTGATIRGISACITRRSAKWLRRCATIRSPIPIRSIKRFLNLPRPPRCAKS